MDAAQRIRDAVADVARMRADSVEDTTLHAAVIDIKRLQSRRFAATYADMLRGGPLEPAARFFLQELYGEKDYADRDAQFAKIAGAIERLFPAQVVDTAVRLAQLHALTERLDFELARAWRDPGLQNLGATARYALAWQQVGRRAERERQLQLVMEIGAELARLTRTPGLRLALKMMRAPASAAGLSSLQRFLESGFDTFAAIARSRPLIEGFLGAVRERESALMQTLFGDDLVASETELGRLLGQAR